MQNSSSDFPFSTLWIDLNSILAPHLGGWGVAVFGLLNIKGFCIPHFFLFLCTVLLVERFVLIATTGKKC
jgi:hypothetical protein